MRINILHIGFTNFVVNFCGFTWGVSSQKLMLFFGGYGVETFVNP